MSIEPTLAPDAAMVLGIASTAMPFARTPEAEAERWLRVLRLHGEVGEALQALGVSEGSLRTHGAHIDRKRPGGHTSSGGPTSSAGPARIDDRDVVARVTEDAVQIASQRGTAGVATTDVLMAVMHVYGEDFDRVLWHTAPIATS